VGVTLNHRGLNTKRPTIVFFLGVPRNLSRHMIRQHRTGDIGLVRSREKTVRSRTPTLLSQSRLSAMLFLQSSELGPPYPQSSVSPPPLVPGGGGH
jgi:hypothetical protein